MTFQNLNKKKRLEISIPQNKNNNLIAIEKIRRMRQNESGGVVRVFIFRKCVEEVHDDCPCVVVWQD